MGTNSLLFIACPKSINFRTILAFHVYMLPFLFSCCISHFHRMCCNAKWEGAISRSLLSICSKSPTKICSSKEGAPVLPTSSVLLVYLPMGWWQWPVLAQEESSLTPSWSFKPDVERDCFFPLLLRVPVDVLQPLYRRFLTTWLFSEEACVLAVGLWKLQVFPVFLVFPAFSKILLAGDSCSTCFWHGF